MRFNITQRAEINTRPRQGTADQLPHGHRPRHRIPGGLAGMANASSTNHTMNAIAIVYGFGQRLQHNCGYPLTWEKPIRLFTKAMTIAFLREHFHLTESLIP